MNADLMIVDYNLKGYRRYACKICTYLKQSNNGFVIVGGYSSKTDGEFMYNFSDIDEFFCIDEKTADYFIEKYRPKAVLVFAHRIIDYLFTIEAHRYNVLVFNFQHGIYMDNTVISRLTPQSIPALLKNKKEKVETYSRYIRQIAHRSIKEELGIALKLLTGEKLYRVMNQKYGSYSNADISFIYGNYWKKYYRTQYLENSTNFITVGYPQLEERSERIPKDLFSEVRPTLCYLAQSSVEDGTISAKIMKDFLKKLIPLLKIVNLVIKLHPRSNIEFYKILTESEESNHVRIWSLPDFPVADMYIGHDSTVLARAMYITDKTLVYKLSPERDTIFSKYAKYHAECNSNLNEVVRKMIDERSDGQCAKNIEDCVMFNQGAGALKMTADIIAERLNQLNME